MLCLDLEFFPGRFAVIDSRMRESLREGGHAASRAPTVHRRRTGAEMPTLERNMHMNTRIQCEKQDRMYTIVVNSKCHFFESGA